MVNLRRGLHRALWAIRGLQVFALVGKSGSGKSFRAQLIAEKYGIDAIVDDGLLIEGQRIRAGRTAKREAVGLSAVKVALFHDPAHAAEVRRTLGESRHRRVLIIGTSDRMTVRIAERLELPVPRKFIHIKDIASQAEIEAALHSRQSAGRHIIPVPEIEVKRATPHIVIDSIKIFLRRGLRRKRGVSFEKTVVSPDRQRGQITVSEAALSQMIIHCVAEFEASFGIDRLVVSGDPRQPVVEVVISGEYGTPVAGRLHELRDYIIRTVERYSGLTLSREDVTLGGMA